MSQVLAFYWTCIIKDREATSSSLTSCALTRVMSQKALGFRARAEQIFSSSSRVYTPRVLLLSPVLQQQCTTSRVIEFPTISDMPEFQLVFSAHLKNAGAQTGPRMEWVWIWRGILNIKGGTQHSVFKKENIARGVSVFNGPGKFVTVKPHGLMVSLSTLLYWSSLHGISLNKKSAISSSLPQFPLFFF